MNGNKKLNLSESLEKEGMDGCQSVLGRLFTGDYRRAPLSRGKRDGFKRGQAPKHERAHYVSPWGEPGEATSPPEDGFDLREYLLLTVTYRPLGLG